MDENVFRNRIGNDRISSRQIDELIGIARGVCADGMINQQEAEFLEKWLAASVGISGDSVLIKLYDRIAEALSDGVIDETERKELFEVLTDLAGNNFELGETLKPTSLPYCNPAPQITFEQNRFTFTGTFLFGKRRDCEQRVIDLGADAGSLTQKTRFLVIGTYATESWKHSNMGAKILKAVDMRDRGIPISIISEKHWNGAF